MSSWIIIGTSDHIMRLKWIPKGVVSCWVLAVQNVILVHVCKISVQFVKLEVE